MGSSTGYCADPGEPDLISPLARSRSAKLKAIYVDDLFSHVGRIRASFVGLFESVVHTIKFCRICCIKKRWMAIRNIIMIIAALC